MTIPDEAVQAAEIAIHCASDTADAKELALAALTAALPFLTGVTVKKLEWFDVPGISTAHNNQPRYCATKTHNGKGEFSWSLEIHGLFSAKFETLEAAKAAAQADYEARFWSMAEVSALAPSPRAQALEEAAKIALDVSENGEYHGEASVDSTSSIYQQGAFEVYEAIRALSSQPVANALPQDVINLVLAAREAWETWQLPEEEFKRLDTALEAFASRVPYENEPDALPASPGASSTRPTGGSDADA
ncbi:hypothetical protein U2P60_14735 [Brucella sp. H1_1004]|uniref:hypothetical protein n=1 Tax=Brucella sp. H1_1004 TaxID=3110109 RepID=UPI0039B4E9D2